MDDKGRLYSHDPRRRRYVVTLVALEGETVDDTDRRICELLGTAPHKSRVTVTAYDPATNGFIHLAGHS